VVPMEEAEVVSTVAVVAVGVFTAEAAERIAAVVVACTAAAPAFTAAADRITGTADRVRTG